METIGTYADMLYISDNLWRQRIEEAGYYYINKTHRNIMGIAKNHIIPLWGDCYPDRLSPKIIKEALRKLSLTGGAKNRILKYLSNIYLYLAEEDIIDFNPVPKVIRFSRKQKKERGIITNEEIIKLFPETHEERLKIWGTQRYLCAFMVLKDTGLRPGELAALKWSDWYPEDYFIPIIKAIESGTKNKIKSTKTGIHRPALVTQQTATELEILRKIAKQDTEHFIFAGIKNNIPYDSHRLCYALRRALIKVGIDKKEYSPYWFRHTFNTNALVKFPEEKVRILMGHITPKMTIQYRHPDIETLRKEAKRLEGL
jgi:integrase